MTEITEHKKLPGAIEHFVLNWGDMGGVWGVNRSVSQIHALLYVSEQPMTADDIIMHLSLARSNVSNSLKELQSWQLIHRVPVKGDRRDHFVAETDVWEIASRIAAGRRAREIKPAITTLRQCVCEARNDSEISPVAQKRLNAMLEFTEQLDGWYDQMTGVPAPRLAALIRMGAKVLRFLPLGKIQTQAERRHSGDITQEE